MLCVEIISSEQSVRDIQERTDDYLAMGVRGVWVLDPVRRGAFVPGPSGSLQLQQGILAVADTPIQLELDEILQEFHDLAAGR